MRFLSLDVCFASTTSGGRRIILFTLLSDFLTMITPDINAQAQLILVLLDICRYHQAHGHPRHTVVFQRLPTPILPKLNPVEPWFTYCLLHANTLILNRFKSELFTKLSQHISHSCDAHNTPTYRLDFNSQCFTYWLIEPK